MSIFPWKTDNNRRFHFPLSIMMLTVVVGCNGEMMGAKVVDTSLNLELFLSSLTAFTQGIISLSCLQRVVSVQQLLAITSFQSSQNWTFNDHHRTWSRYGMATWTAAKRATTAIMEQKPNSAMAQSREIWTASQPIRNWRKTFRTWKTFRPAQARILHLRLQRAHTHKDSHMYTHTRSTS